MKIEHIALYVEDLEGARNFFIKYLEAKSNEGYHNPQTDFRSIFFLLRMVPDLRSCRDRKW